MEASNAAMVLANDQSEEVYSIVAATDVYSKTMPLTIYFEDCNNAVIVPVANTEIIAVIDTVGNSLSYTDGTLGFVSSIPANCALGTGLTATSYTFCDAATCAVSTVANYWETDTNSLKLTRTADTVLG